MDYSHGLTVLQLCWAVEAQAAIDSAQWPDCKTLRRVVSQRIFGNKACGLGKRYYVSLRTLSAKELAQAVRAHRGIENRLHWMLDVGQGEDNCMVRKGNAARDDDIRMAMLGIKSL